MRTNYPDAYEWHIVESLSPVTSPTVQPTLHMGPFATEEECRGLLSTLRHMPRFSQGNMEVLRKYKRRQKRIRIRLPVQICAPGAREDSWLGYTVDISVLGARIVSACERHRLGEIVEVSFGLRRAVFRIVWVGTPGGATQEQIGVECLNPENNIWDLDLADRGSEEPLVHEITVARAVQSNLLPRDRPPLRTLDYSASCMQARIVGGDYYDFLDLGAGQVGFVLADVSGKGVPAALLMANLQGSLHSYAGHVDFQSLPRILHSVNRHLYKHTEAGRYTTLFFGWYHDEGRVLHYVNCGHNSPLLLRHDLDVERLAPTATVLGLFREWECSIGRIELKAGDVLTIFTDGIIETRDEAGEEFGEARLLNAVQQCGDQGAVSTLRSVEQAIAQFRSGAVQEDDLTLVVARSR